MKRTGEIEFKQIDNLSNEEWRSYEGFKVGESNRREKQQNSVSHGKQYNLNNKINDVYVVKSLKNIHEANSFVRYNIPRFCPLMFRVLSRCINGFPGIRRSGYPLGP